MNKKDISEIKKRFKKDTCSISRLAGCYVNAGKEKLVSFTEDFLNLPEEEFYKYLEIASKTLSGTIGNNVLELDFPIEEEQPGGKQQFFMGLRDSNLKNEELLDLLYDKIIENYFNPGNYLILVYYDTMDVIVKAADNTKLDESSEIYEYMIISICPVSQSKGALGYNRQENKIEARERDWVVGAPEVGVLFPAFDDRSANIHKAGFFLKKPEDNHQEFIEGVLGCIPRNTAKEQLESFQTIVKKAYGGDTEECRESLINIQESFQAMSSEDREKIDLGMEPAKLDNELLDRICRENDIPDNRRLKILENSKEEFTEEMPPLLHLYNNKELEKAAREKEKREMIKEVGSLKEELKEKDRQIRSVLEEKAEDRDILVHINPERIQEIHMAEVEGQKCLLIPISKEDRITVNGAEKDWME